MKKLFFIEGVDGAGKSSLLHELLKQPAPRGCSWYQTVEPRVPPAPHVTPGMAQALHFNLDRRLHLEKLATLPNDTIIVCDRGPMSTAAYQGAAQGVSMHDLTSLHHLTVSDFRLDFDFHNIILQVPFAEALRRVKERDGKVSEDAVTTMSEAWNFYDRRYSRVSIFGTEHVVGADRFMDDLVTVVYGIIERN